MANCARPGCNRKARPRSDYCSDQCWRKHYWLKRRRVDIKPRINTPRGVEVIQPGMADPYPISKAEWEATKNQYPPGTVALVDGREVRI